MIKELVQFVKDIPPEVKERAIVPKAGLHILVHFDGDGQGHVINSERHFGKKHEEPSQFLKDCALKQQSAWMIDTNKCFDLPMKGIHSASPFCVAFKRESWIGGDKYPSEGKKPNILERLDSYFAKTFEEKYDLDEIEKQKTIQFKDFLKNEMNDILETIPEYSALDWSDYILIYRDIPIERYLGFQKIYLSGGLFNTSEYNLEFEGVILGTSNFYNGFNNKKPFLTHQTASFDITSRISAEEAKALADFQVYAGKRLFPNPIPIFIDKPELTEEVIRIYHRSEDHKISHREIISELWKRKKDLGNYYLLYFSGGAIQDFDFVSKFRYLLSEEKDNDGKPKSWVIENVMEIRGKDKNPLPPESLSSVFDFERIVIRELFGGVLIRVYEKNGDITNNYFSDIKGHPRPAYLRLTLKYRKTVYDFIYKSMRSGIGINQFKDICMAGILDDLKQNKKYAIKAKLNMYFSLCQYFEQSKNSPIMPSKVKEHQEKLRELLDQKDHHLDEDDELYAFAAGQLIYYLLSKSEAGERTHAVLEPFLQKTNQEAFNRAIATIIAKYKHAIGFDFVRFNKLAGEVLDYKDVPSLEPLKATILAGYFSPNVLFQPKKTDSPS